MQPVALSPVAISLLSTIEGLRVACSALVSIITDDATSAAERAVALASLKRMKRQRSRLRTIIVTLYGEPAQ